MHVIFHSVMFQVSDKQTLLEREKMNNNVSNSSNYYLVFSLTSHYIPPPCIVFVHFVKCYNMDIFGLYTGRGAACICTIIVIFFSWVMVIYIWAHLTVIIVISGL